MTRWLRDSKPVKVNGRKTESCGHPAFLPKGLGKPRGSPALVAWVVLPWLENGSGERRRAASKSKGDACASPLVGHCKVISFSSRPSWSPSLQPFSSLAFLFSLFHSHGSCDIVSSQFVLCIESAQRIVKQKTSADVCIWATLDGFSNASCRALRMLVARNRNSIQGGQLCECVQPA